MNAQFHCGGYIAQATFQNDSAEAGKIHASFRSGQTKSFDVPAGGSATVEHLEPQEGGAWNKSDPIVGLHFEHSGKKEELAANDLGGGVELRSYTIDASGKVVRNR